MISTDYAIRHAHPRQATYTLTAAGWLWVPYFTVLALVAVCYGLGYVDKIRAGVGL